LFVLTARRLGTKKNKLITTFGVNDNKPPGHYHDKIAYTKMPLSGLYFRYVVRDCISPS